MKEAIGTGKTVDDAINKGCEELGLTREAVQFEILELPKKGFFGLSTSPAKVRVFVEKSKVDAAVEYVTEILEVMGVHANITVKQEGSNAELLLEGEGLGVIIGRRGETLDALQYLSGLVANRLEGDYVKITLDSGNYREKREKTIEALAIKIAKNAVKTGRSSTLEPMNSYERRIIHAAVSQIEGATSASIGEEPNRRVVISSTNPRKYPPREGGRGRNDRRPGRGGNRGRDGYQNRDHAPRAPRDFKRSDEEKTSAAPAAEPSSRPAATRPEEGKDLPLYGKIEI